MPPRPPARCLRVALWSIVFAAVIWHPARAAGFFDRSAFGRIRFAGACAEKEWALGPDNTFELILAPEADGFCKAVLEFYSPPSVAKASSLRFNVRATRSGPSLRVGLREEGGTGAVYGAESAAYRPSSEWSSEAARVNDLKPGWNPKEIAALYFAATASPHARPGATAAVLIRHIHFATGSSLPVPNRPAPGLSAIFPAAKHAPAGALHRMTLGLRRFSGRGFLGIVCALALAGLAARGQTRRRRILSPLYELDARAWKTHRDPHGVVQYGGFRKITLVDLKAIRNAGFNAVWLMGVWEIGPRVRDLSRRIAPDFQGSPFAILDYQVSSDLGTEQDFRELVQRAHSQRLSVLVDFVPNHMGLDTSWLNDHPEYFIHRVLNDSEAALPDEELQKRFPGHFPYRTPAYPENGHRVPKTIMVAYGKDPYFYPWIDTAQLDFAQPGLRRKMLEVLTTWAGIVDGMRCDMAMLVLRDQVKIHRHPEMSWGAFNDLMPAEFWTEAIPAVKRINPHFVFLAETYWAMEGQLQNMGFDFTYNKPLYEAICSSLHSGHAEGLMNFLRLLGSEFLKKSIHYLENHDEERAMNTLGDERQRAAAAVLCTLPGVALLHQGQMEGKRERLPVQRVVPLHNETEHHSLHHFYRRLLRATSLPVFQEGRLIPLYSNNTALVSYARVEGNSKVIVIVNTDQKPQKGSVFLIPGIRLDTGASYRLNDLFYELKDTQSAGRPTVKPSYVYPAAQLINQGLYIELEPFDAHIFLVEPDARFRTQEALTVARQILGAWPPNRLVRRLLGAHFTRSSDQGVAQE